MSLCPKCATNPRAVTIVLSLSSETEVAGTSTEVRFPLCGPCGQELLQGGIGLVHIAQGLPPPPAPET